MPPARQVPLPCGGGGGRGWAWRGIIADMAPAGDERRQPADDRADPRRAFEVTMPSASGVQVGDGNVQINIISPQSVGPGMSFPGGGDAGPGGRGPAGWLLGEVTDAFALEVHRAVQPDDGGDLPALTAYVPRGHDEALGAVVRAAAGGRSGIAVLVGGFVDGEDTGVLGGAGAAAGGGRVAAVAPGRAGPPGGGAAGAATGRAADGGVAERGPALSVAARQRSGGAGRGRAAGPAA
jgi:hypothetical protein